MELTKNDLLILQRCISAYESGLRNYVSRNPDKEPAIKETELEILKSKLNRILSENQ